MIRPETMVSSCYSLEVYMQAYDKAIMPCRDKTEWTRTNGPDVLPPYYEKKVGRPKRCRRKDPEENENDTKISRHDVKMHCSYCRSPEHTKQNCGQYKADLEQGIAFPPNQVSSEQVPAEQDAAEQVRAEEIQTEEVSTDQMPREQDAAEKDAAEQVAAEEVPSDQVKRKIKPSRKKLEQKEAQKEYEARTKKAKHFDENGDIDIPEILTHIIPKNLVPSNDPTHLTSTMVYKLAHEIPTRANRVVEPLPEESRFVTEHRAAIPARGRTSSALGAWRATRGRGARTVVEHVAPRTRGANRGRGKAKPKGRTKWLMFGDDGQSTSHPQEEYQNVEFNTTQGAPGEYSD